VAGVDLNPFAVAIARFRLLLAALQASDVQRLAEAPDFRIHVAIGDSLLHGTRFGLTATDDMFQGAEHFAGTGLAHAYASEDLAEVQPSWAGSTTRWSATRRTSSSGTPRSTRPIAAHTPVAT
jgi:hypothetical protein